MKSRSHALFARSRLASTVAAIGLALGAVGIAHADSSAEHPAAARRASVGDESIRPFPKINVPQKSLDEMRRRIAATQWPEKETVTDTSQGVPLATMQKLARYWATDYDWRRTETKLNALPQFMTTIDGVDIHFVHVRSKNPKALPLVINHGWPGSILEQTKLIDLLTDPVAHGGKAEDAFDVVIPSMPGYGFSGKPTGTGWGPEHMARAWAELMHGSATSTTSPRAVTGAPLSSIKWGCRHRPACSRSTPTCPRRCRPSSTRRC